jgi:hypothetical protein
MTAQKYSGIAPVTGGVQNTHEGALFAFRARVGHAGGTEAKGGGDLTTELPGCAKADTTPSNNARHTATGSMTNLLGSSRELLPHQSQVVPVTRHLKKKSAVFECENGRKSELQNFGWGLNQNTQTRRRGSNVRFGS